MTPSSGLSYRNGLAGLTVGVVFFALSGECSDNSTVVLLFGIRRNNSSARCTNSSRFPSYTSFITSLQSLRVMLSATACSHDRLHSQLFRYLAVSAAVW